MKKDPIKHAMDLLHAHTLRSMLAHSNTNIRTLVTRDELASALTNLGDGVDVDLALELLTSEDLQAGRLPCTAAVIDAGTHRPSPRFFATVRDGGVDIDDEDAYWQTTLSELGVVPHTLAEICQGRLAELPTEHPLRHATPGERR